MFFECTLAKSCSSFEAVDKSRDASQNALVPTRTETPHTTPSAPFPGVCVNVPSTVASFGCPPARGSASAAVTTATASGCRLFRSTAAAMRRRVVCFSVREERPEELSEERPEELSEVLSEERPKELSNERPFQLPSPSQTLTTRVTTGRPIVRVPVLSKTTVSRVCARSKTSPPLISNPCLAPSEVPTSTAVGVASPRAHGHATTNTEAASCSPNNNGAVAGLPTPDAKLTDCSTCGKILVPTVAQNANVNALAPITPYTNFPETCDPENKGSVHLLGVYWACIGRWPGQQSP